MVNEQDEWYVDPNSLATNETVDTTATPEPGKTTVAQSLAPRMTVTPVPAADTKLYYNANGGKYYHLDPNCSAVNSKYLPMAILCDAGIVVGRKDGKWTHYSLSASGCRQAVAMPRSKRFPPLEQLSSSTRGRGPKMRPSTSYRPSVYRWKNSP